jgi:hypothetical protein
MEKKHSKSIHRLVEIKLKVYLPKIKTALDFGQKKNRGRFLNITVYTIALVRSKLYAERHFFFFEIPDPSLLLCWKT